MITRRQLLGGLAGAGGALGLGARPGSAEPPPETSTVRLVWAGALCQAPQYVAEELLQGEGFTDIQYIKRDGIRGMEMALASGEADISTSLPPSSSGSNRAIPS